MGHKSRNHSPRRTMFSWLIEQAVGPLSVQLWGSTLLLSLNIYSSSKNLLSGPKECMLSSVKIYINKACQTLPSVPSCSFNKYRMMHFEKPCSARAQGLAEEKRDANVQSEPRNKGWRKQQEAWLRRVDYGSWLKLWISARQTWIWISASPPMCGLGQML